VASRLAGAPSGRGGAERAAARGDGAEGIVVSPAVAATGAAGATGAGAGGAASGATGVGSPIARIAMGRMIAMLSSVTIGWRSMRG
jgi:hypothetical protein